MSVGGIPLWLFVCLFSWSQTHLHWSMWGIRQIYLETETQEWVLTDERCCLFLFKEWLLKLEASLCSAVNTREKVLGGTGAHWQNIHRAKSKDRKKKQFITVTLACRHSALRTGKNPKQKADFFFKLISIYISSYQCEGHDPFHQWEHTHKGEDLSCGLTPWRAAGFCGAVQHSGSFAGVEGSTPSKSSPHSTAESFLNCNHMQHIKKKKTKKKVKVHCLHCAWVPDNRKWNDLLFQIVVVFFRLWWLVQCRSILFSQSSWMKRTTETVCAGSGGFRFFLPVCISELHVPNEWEMKLWTSSANKAPAVILWKQAKVRLMNESICVSLLEIVEQALLRVNGWNVQKVDLFLKNN